MASRRACLDRSVRHTDRVGGILLCLNFAIAAHAPPMQVWVIVYGVTTREANMAKPNYQFEKRQRELEKERKKQAKALKKAPPAQPAPVSPGTVVPPEK